MMKIKINKKWFSIEYLWFHTIILLVYVKLTFSYLDVGTSWWGKMEHQVTNFDKFNFFNMSKGFAGKIEYLLIPLLFIYVLIYFNFLGRFKKTFVFLISLMVFNVFTFVFTSNTILDSIVYSLKMIGPILFFLVILIYSKRNNVNLRSIMLKLFKYCGLLILIGFIFFDSFIRLNKMSLPVYFGNLHTHSYILAIIFIGISFLFYKKIGIFKLLLFYFLTVLFLYFGYNVRTSLIVYLIYVFASLFVKSLIFREISLLGVLSFPIIGLIMFFLFDFDFDSFSSGRLSMYQAKYEMLKSSSALELLFGHGAGSDMININIWAGARGSHNDYLTYLVENGLLFMLSFIVLIVSLIPTYKKINIIYISLIVGYLFSSFISNGIAVRTLAGYLFFMVLAFVYLSIWGEKEGWTVNKQMK